jgi:hypothetical protein
MHPELASPGHCQRLAYGVIVKDWHMGIVDMCFIVILNEEITSIPEVQLNFLLSSLDSLASCFFFCHGERWD